MSNLISSVRCIPAIFLLFHMTFTFTTIFGLCEVCTFYWFKRIRYWKKMMFISLDSIELNFKIVFHPLKENQWSSSNLKSIIKLYRHVNLKQKHYFILVYNVGFNHIGTNFTEFRCYFYFSNLDPFIQWKFYVNFHTMSMYAYNLF